MQIIQAGGAPKRAYTIHAVAVYDASGRVVHMHHAVLFAERRPDAKMLGDDALSHAKASGHAGALKTLVLKAPPTPGMYRVDPARRVLVPIATPPRSTRRKR